MREGSKIGPYRIVRQLGHGGMGMVYEGIHEEISRRVAIKILNSEYARSEDAVARLFNEARAVNLIEHPGLVQISDFGKLGDGTPYLVMELLKGQSLAERLAQRGSLPIRTSLQIAVQVADALCSAHRKGIVHRDLKPENLMLVAEALAPGGERVKVLDFGIAKLVSRERGQTDGSVIMGTPRYMSEAMCIRWVSSCTS